MIKTQKDSNSKDSTPTIFKFYAVKWLDEILLDVKDTSVIKYRNIVTSYLLPHFGRSLVSQISRRRICAYVSSH